VEARDAEIRSTEAELSSVRARIAAAEAELRNLESNVIALRRGDVVIASGQPLASAKVKLENPRQAREVIDALLQQANLSVYRRLLPGERPDQRVLLVQRDDVERLEQLLGRPGSWVVTIRSAEKRVLAFPDLRPNRTVVRQGEVLASTTIEADVRSPEEVRSRLNLMLASAFARAQRQGTLEEGLQFDVSAFNDLGRRLSERPPGQRANLEAVALRDAETPDPILVELRWIQP
jgi:uncharacterized protein (DUF3084 family)